MDLLHRLIARLTQEPRHATLTHAQLVALSDLVALSMTIDRHIATQEREAIDALLLKLPWPPGQPAEQAIHQSVRRAWSTIEGGAQALEAHCVALSDALGSTWLRELAFESCLKIIHADGHLSQPEQALLTTLERTLGLAPARALALREQARSEAALKPSP